MSIVVTHASGRLGSRVAEILARTGGAGARLIVADAEPERLGGPLRAVAETRQADFSDPITLTVAFMGAETVLLTGGIEGGPDAAGIAAAIEAARAVGVERLVLISSIDPTSGNPALWAAADRTAEAMVRSSGLGWTILRLQEALEDFVLIGRTQQPTGRMFANRGGGASAPIALDDASAAVAAVLAASGQNRGRTFELTGPDLVTTADLAAGLGIADIVHKDAKYLDQLIQDGHSPGQAKANVALGRAVREGYYAVASQDVRTLTGRTAVALAARLRG